MARRPEPRTHYLREITLLSRIARTAEKDKRRTKDWSKKVIELTQALIEALNEPPEDEDVEK